MKKIISIFMIILLTFSFVACGNNSNSDTDKQTGYETGVQYPMLYLDGKLYEQNFHFFTSNDSNETGLSSITFKEFSVKYTADLIGEVKSVDNEKSPTLELQASRLDIGAKIYRSSDGTIFVKISESNVIALKESK